MAVAGVLATALTTHATRALGIFMDNVDVTGGSFSTYGSPAETLVINEAGPGGVSSCTFVIEDERTALSLPTEGMTVRIHDYFADLPLFLGFVQGWKVTPFGLGRRVTVECIGIEAVLDWALVASFVATAQPWNTIMDNLKPQITLPGFDLRMIELQPTGYPSGISNLTTPVENVSNFTVTVTLTNVSLREAFRILWGAEQTGGAVNVYRATVDFWGNLRVFQTNLPPSDYVDLTITDTTAGPIVAADMSIEADATATVHRVYVIGSGAGTGLVSDGTALPGSIPQYTEPLSTSAALLQSYGLAYIAGHQAVQRGTFTIETHRPTTNIRAGSVVTITDAQVGLSAQAFAITSIEKTFTSSGLQTWAVTYGTLPLSVADQLRRLTRGTLS